MEMIVDLNSPNVSSTMNFETNNKWDVSNIFDNEFSLDVLISTLEVVDKFKKKYPNDDTFTNFEECVREEICQMFGGSLYDGE